MNEPLILNGKEIIPICKAEAEKLKYYIFDSLKKVEEVQSCQDKDGYNVYVNENVYLELRSGGAVKATILRIYRITNLMYNNKDFKIVLKTESKHYIVESEISIIKRYGSPYNF